MKVLNLYAGIGGNRKLWEDVEVTAVENVPYIAEVYRKLFPQDTLIEEDAHEYLLKHFREFDFIWSSPPCPTHSRINLSFNGIKNPLRYPDMTLYQEIIFLKQYCKVPWVVENVIPYYEVLIGPKVDIDRHLFWSNFYISPLTKASNPDISRSHVSKLAEYHGIILPEGTKDQRKLLRNAVHPDLGLHIFSAAQKEIKQEVLL